MAVELRAIGGAAGLTAALEGRILLTVPVACTNCCLPLPQHILLLLIFNVKLRRLRFRPCRQSFQKNCRTRQCRPQHQPFLPTLTHEQRHRNGDPEAEAVEAIQKPSPEAVSEAAPQAHQEVPWSVLRVQQMSHAPYAKHSEDEPIELHSSSAQPDFSVEDPASASLRSVTGPPTRHYCCSA